MVNHRGGVGNQNALNDLRGISAYEKVVPEIRNALIDEGIEALEKMTVSPATRTVRGVVALSSVGVIMGGAGFWPLLTIAPFAFVVLNTLRKDIKSEADLKSDVVEEIKEILTDLNEMPKDAQNKWFEEAKAEAANEKELYKNATAETPLPPAIPKPTHSKVANIPGVPQPDRSRLPAAPTSPSPRQTGLKPNQSRVSSYLPRANAGRKTRKLGNKFNRCVKSVRSTVRARKGSNKESAAIAICTKSVLQTRGKTMKRYRKNRLITQKKFRGGCGDETGCA